MPLYKYKCENCGVFEARHKMNDRLYSCPECGSDVEKVIGNPSIRFKGNNFYSNKS